MTLPAITLPSGFPLWQADPHETQADPAYAHVKMQTGHLRIRRVFTTAPEVRTVALQLTDAQALAFHDWFERDLLAGERQFAAKVKTTGRGYEWRAARFVAPYEAEPINLGGGKLLWRIEAQLLMTGPSYPSGPILSTLEAEIAAPLGSRAAGVTSRLLAAEVAVPLDAETADRRIAAEVAVPLDGGVTAEGVTPLWAEVAVPLVAVATPPAILKLLAAEVAVPLDGSATMPKFYAEIAVPLEAAA